MPKNPADKGIVSENFKGVGPITPEMIKARARELAAIDGRSRVSRADREQARRELAGDGDADAKEKAIDAMPESQRWDPVPGSPGHQVPDAPNEDEDEEGRSDAERLVEEGVNEAEHDQMVQAARAARRQGRP